MIDVEAYIVFLAAIFFSFLYFATKGDAEADHGAIVAFGGMASACWLVLSLLWMFLVNQPDVGGIAYDTFAVSTLFFGFSVLIIMFLLVDEYRNAIAYRKKDLEGFGR